jgi:hypothetical protein
MSEISEREISQRRTNGLKCMEVFQSKVRTQIEAIEKEIEEYMSGAGPTRRRPRVSWRAIARRAKVSRTTINADYHSELKTDIAGLKEKLVPPRKTVKPTAPAKKCSRTARPKQKDLINQLNKTMQDLRLSERERGRLAQEARIKELSHKTSILKPDDQIIEIVKSLLAERKE